uniref:G protein-coupled receptor 17 n=1 Tax=Salmo trutta TaxID=8032 RepID=A0A673YAW2_SALTR
MSYRLRVHCTIMNYTEEEIHGLHTKASHRENIIFASFYILVFAVASPSKLFLRHLAIADVSYVLILPMRVVYHLSDSQWPFGEVPCRLVGFLFYLNMYCSLYFMTCIGLDRLLALVLPLKSREMRKTAYARAVVVSLWVTVTVSMTPLLFSKDQTMTIQVDNTTVVMLVSYVLILLKLKGVKQQERPVGDKAIRMIILVMVNFLVAFVPYHVNHSIYIERHTHSDIGTASIKALALANQVTSALTCVSGVLDPIIYFFLARTYQSILLQDVRLGSSLGSGWATQGHSETSHKPTPALSWLCA